VASLQAEASALKANNAAAFKAVNQKNNAYARQLNAPACG
jgi:hypothetical protein